MEDFGTQPTGRGRHSSSTGRERLASNYSFANGAVLFGALIIELLILCRAPDIAKVLNVVDHPDSVRKRHVRATPLVGGLAIMTSAVLSTAVPLIGERSAGTALTVA